MKRGKRLQAVILSVCIVVSLINCPSYYTKAYSEDKFKYDDLVYIMEDDTITIVGYEGDDNRIQFICWSTWLWKGLPAVRPVAKKRKNKLYFVGTVKKV